VHVLTWSVEKHVARRQQEANKKHARMSVRFACQGSILLQHGALVSEVAVVKQSV
jgi:hypothetical protein